MADEKRLHRYLFAFYKKGNMRFISHLDLQRLFKRCIKRARIVPAYSNGFNPHEKVNIVHPLPLGFESACDYFEMDTQIAYEADTLADLMNQALPEGVRFTLCREIPHAARNSSSVCDSSVYEAILPVSQDLDIEAFLKQDAITILKKDKKTKQLVEKDIKPWLYSLEPLERTQEGCRLRLHVRSASNETLNPVPVLESLCRFSGVALDKEALRLMRLDIYARRSDALVPLSRYYEQEECHG